MGENKGLLVSERSETGAIEEFGMREIETAIAAGKENKLPIVQEGAPRRVRHLNSISDIAELIDALSHEQRRRTSIGILPDDIASAAKRDSMVMSVRSASAGSIVKDESEGKEMIIPTPLKESEGISGSKSRIKQLVNWGEGSMSWRTKKVFPEIAKNNIVRDHILPFRSSPIETLNVIPHVGKRKSCVMPDGIQFQRPVHIPRYMIRQQSQKFNAWNAFIIFLVLLEILFVPYAFAFPAVSEVKAIRNLEFVLDIIFIIDFFSQFITTYFEKDVEIFSKRKIALHYILSIWFLIDFGSSLPLHWFAGSNAKTNFLKGLKLFRMLRIGKLLKRMDDILRASAYRFGRLFGFILLLTHWVACMYHVLLTTYSNTEDLDETITRQYLRAVYVGIAMLYSTYESSGVLEVDLFAAVVTVLGSGVQASVFGAVAVLVASFDEDEQKFRKKRADVSSIMNKLELSKEIQDRVIFYYESMWSHQRVTTDSVNTFISDLSPALKVDVQVSLYRELVIRIPFLRSKRISSIFIEAFALIFSTRMYVKGDMIMRRGEYGDWMGFVGKGCKVAIFDPTEKTPVVLAILKEGEYLGEMGLMFEIKRTTDVQALTWCQMHTISRDDFIAVKAQYPRDATFVEREIERIRQEKNYKLSSVKR